MTINGYGLNGVSIKPTVGRWVHQPVDVDGGGRAIYPETYSFELEWNFTTFDEWWSTQDVWDGLRSSGTAVVQLPAHPASLAQGAPFQYYEYSGVTINEPEVGPYFAEHPSDMKLLISNIRVK